MMKKLFYAIIFLCLIVGSCKKDQLVVNEEKEYSQIDHVPSNAYDGGWALTLRPEGGADVNPGGEVSVFHKELFVRKLCHKVSLNYYLRPLQDKNQFN